MKLSTEKQKALEYFRDYVSTGKADFFKSYGMDFVMGDREGPWLVDIDGQKRLYNLHCNGGVFNLGHRNKELVTLLKESLDDLDIGNHHLMSRERAELARMLSDLMPGDLNYTVFGVSGGEAVDLAIKVARGYTGKNGIISAKGGYHGHTGLALAAGDEKYRQPFGATMPGFEQIPFGNMKALEEKLNRDTAAVLLETIPATLGMVVPSKDYLQSLRQLCDDRSVLLILDEVQTGLGRTGKLWAFEHYDIIPDIVVLGKGLSGGIYPITATVIREPLEKVFHADPFIHVSTFGGAEIGCRVARRVLEISSKPDFLQHVKTLEDQFNSGIEILQKKHPKFLKGFRHLGLMMGLVLKNDLAGPVLTKTAFDHDLLLIYANNEPSVCQLLPPLVMEPKDVNLVIAKLDSALAAARRLLPAIKLKRGLEHLWNKVK